MNAVVVIPARYASSRLPAKPLLNETGKYLIQHVHEQAVKAKRVSGVVVATDDQRILDAVRSFGGRAAMTREDHASGTDRIAEVAATLDADVILNLQGDEPQFDPAHLDLLTDLLVADPTVGMATLATPLRNKTDYLNPNVVKVVCDHRSRALYFSRSPIPMVRDGDPDFAHTPPLFLQHLGVYAYRRDVLLTLSATPPHPLELAEKLEQLRALAHGISIKVGVIPTAHRGVDTPADYAAFVASYRAGS
jgi:3-deoxy-manno-octulosonate cytidylyltransferase (CMP-KDO synthetase)